MKALVAAMLLAGLPFPAPRLATVTDKTKFDPGVVVSYDATRTELRVKTVAGLFTVKAGPDIQVFDAAGKPIGTAAVLKAGQKVRIWYVVDNGAKAVEIAVE
jgi:phage baseplate assembly protein gpV